MAIGSEGDSEGLPELSGVVVMRPEKQDDMGAVTTPESQRQGMMRYYRQGYSA